jgi:hypothetical protein
VPSNEEKLIEFTKKIPDHILLPEAGRRIAAKRDRKATPRRKVVRECIFCNGLFGAIEMRAHVASAHPGGLREHEPVPRIRKRGRPRKDIPQEVEPCI